MRTERMMRRHHAKATKRPDRLTPEEEKFYGRHRVVSHGCTVLGPELLRRIARDQHGMSVDHRHVMLRVLAGESGDEALDLDEVMAWLVLNIRLGVLELDAGSTLDADVLMEELEMPHWDRLLAMCPPPIQTTPAMV